jgi:hypothetical protein
MDKLLKWGIIFFIQQAGFRVISIARWTISNYFINFQYCYGNRNFMHNWFIDTNRSMEKR